jgi:ribulose-phosphate 3-epimerase
MNKTFLLAPSILSADFSKLGESVALISKKGGDWVHIDVMDGHFVPNMTFGPPVIAALRQYSDLPFDVHLMVNAPETFVDGFAKAGANFITFHIEATTQAKALINRIHAAGCKAGISIKPETPIEAIRDILPYVEIVLVMTVNPGQGGQTILAHCLDKVRLLKKIKQESGFSYIVSVDGGVNSGTLATVLDAGTDVIVSGSAFFRGEFDGIR